VTHLGRSVVFGAACAGIAYAAGAAPIWAAVIALAAASLWYATAHH
jgi:hypothetical protein